ncbi:AAA family ATPase [Nocardia pseudobrasiliensis]|uniref:WD40 repeat protein n=1 Tax=Nocardia pseudobrasiliensis TaxID=45979 RepID=A0A370HY72_9NOCA|nr:AAA family ATPase [Nocardia pseudobrasiliensis]RDI63463.1 WD40 repeat protein [Nocardia pseudobrasiliensis]
MNIRTTGRPRGRDDGGPAAGGRGVFAARLDELFAAAAALPVKSVIRAANARVGEGGGRVTAQRISDWRRGNRTPATFESVRPVLQVLIEEARRGPAANRRIDPALLDLDRWHAVWKAARTEPDPSELDRPPYRGLLAYRAEDRDLYFGRKAVERQLHELVSAVEAEEVTHLVLLLGGAGVGKSSLLAAGLQAAPGSRVPIMMTPGEDPSSALRTALADAPTGRRLLLVDHGEQLFTRCLGAEARQRFLDELAALADPHAEAPTTVVMAIDTTHLNDLGRHPLLLSAMRDRSMVLEPMTEQQMRDAIVGPASAVGLRVEDSLVEVLLRDMAALDPQNTVRLGTLSYALAKTWENRRGRTLTVEAYREIGGVEGAFAKGCERIWALLNAQEQELTRHLLVALTIAGPTAVVRDRVPAHLLIDEAADPAAMRAVITRLIEERAIREYDGDLELVSDLVLTAWPRMCEWLTEEKEFALERQRIETDAREWARQRKPDALLYNRTRLEDAVDVLRHTETSNRLARQFVAESLSRQRRLVRRRRARWAVVAVSTVAAVVLAIAVVTQHLTVSRERQDARVDALLAESQRVEQNNPGLSTQLALAAYRMSPRAGNARARLLATQTLPQEMVSTARHSGPVLAVAADTDRHLVASAGADGAVRLWNLTDRQPLTGHGQPLECRCGGVESVAFAPGGGALAAAGDDGILRLWDVAAARQIGSFDLGTPATTLVYLPDGHTLAVGGVDGSVSFLDVLAPQAINRLGPAVAAGVDPVRVLALAPDAPVLASGGDDRTVRLWSVADPAHPTPIGSAIEVPGALQALAYGPGGRLAAGTADGSIQVWDVHDPAAARLIDRLDDRRVPVAGLSFALGGGFLIAASVDGTMRVWDTRRTDRVSPAGWEVHDNSDSVRALVVTSDTQMVTAGSDGRLRVWGTAIASVPIAFDGTLSSVGFDRDGELLADGRHDGRVGLWDITDPPRSRFLGELIAGPPSRQGVEVALRPDHAMLATSDGTAVRLWSLADPARPAALNLSSPDRLTAPVVFGPNGSRLLTGVDGRSLRLWDVSDAAAVRPVGARLIGSDRDLRAAALTTGGSVVAAADDASRIHIWDLSDPVRSAPRISLDTKGSTVLALRFAPDGKTLFSAEDTGAIHVYDVADPAHAHEIGSVRAHPAAIRTLDIDASGHRLATGGDDQTARLWDITDPAHPTSLGEPLAAPIGWTWFVRFDPRAEDRLFGIGDKASVRWFTDPDTVAAELCETLPPHIDESAWRDLFGAMPRVELCP